MHFYKRELTPVKENYATFTTESPYERNHLTSKNPISLFTSILELNKDLHSIRNKRYVIALANAAAGLS